MAKKDKFIYSTDHLAKIHAPEVKVEEIAKPEVKSTQVWDKKGLIKKATKPKTKVKA